jgi:hypothetical protein
MQFRENNMISEFTSPNSFLCIKKTLNIEPNKSLIQDIINKDIGSDDIKSY